MESIPTDSLNDAARRESGITPTDHGQDILESGEEDVSLTILHHGKPLQFHFPPDSILPDLSTTVADELSIPEPNQKYLVAPKTGLLKPPFTTSTLALSSLVGKKITLIGSTPAQIDVISASLARAQIVATRGAADAAYTFHSVRALPWLPDPARSRRYLEALRDDAGVRAAMRKHRFRVGLLTEMDPASHTTHASRTLGLNRNAGEVIELRLRTDAYDGYRDYKTVRKTLCHELAHNVWAEHDGNFWALTREIEGEVERGDWTRGGRTVGTEEFYNPHDGGYDDGLADEGGWTGGEFVLGGRVGAGAEAVDGVPLSRREILAKAAEERRKKSDESERGDG